MDALLLFLGEVVDWAVNEFLGWSQLSSIRFFILEKLYTPFTPILKQLSIKRIRVNGLSPKPYTQPFTNPSQTLHKPYTLCFAKLVDSTDSHWIGI